jgi:hypothetical protein
MVAGCFDAADIVLFTYRDDDAIVVPILASMRANYEAEKQVIDRVLGPQPGEIPPEIRILYSRKQTLPRQALAWQSPNARSMRAGPD